jgi:hypothetical protein
MKASKSLITLAEKCGINATEMTVEEVRDAYNATLEPLDDMKLDQHDVRLRKALNSLLNENG